MSPFGRTKSSQAASWSPDWIAPMEGVTAIVTGANSGLGFHTSTQLARHGAGVVLACRSRQRGAEAIERITAEVPGANLELHSLDVADLASVRRFAQEWGTRRLDLLVNNAGVMAVPKRQVTPDGFELQLATNHLGHFALTGLLLPSMIAEGTIFGGPPRVVSVSSGVHRIGRFDRADLMSEKHYSAWPAYGRSKLANLLFMRELQRRADDADVRLASLAAHPGYAATNLQHAGPGLAGRPWASKLVDAANRVIAQPAANGAWPVLRAAADPQARSGEFFGPSGLGEFSGPPHRVGMSAAAMDPELASWLWTRSAELTGVSYPALRRA